MVVPLESFIEEAQAAKLSYSLCAPEAPRDAATLRRGSIS
jgi:hypothetical protein